MNASAILNSTIQSEQPFYITLTNFFVVPLLLGNILDIGITKLIGSQSCTFDGTQKICNVAGNTVPAYLREGGRTLLQILIVFLLLRYFSSYFRSSLFPVFGLGVFIYSQPDLQEDFRRFINSILFMIKHY